MCADASLRVFLAVSTENITSYALVAYQLPAVQNVAAAHVCATMLMLCDLLIEAVALDVCMVAMPWH